MATDHTLPVLHPVGPLNVPVHESLLSIPAFQQPTTAGKGFAVPAYLEPGTLYTFLEKGDVIAPHTHDQGNNHYTIVKRGSIAYTIHKEDGSTDSVTLPQGAFLYVDSGVSHSFTALEDGSVCLNLRGATFNAQVAKSQVSDISTSVSTLHGQISALQSQVAALSKLTPDTARAFNLLDFLRRLLTPTPTRRK